MGIDSVVELKKPDVFVNDPITQPVPGGARKIFAKALGRDIECDSFQKPVD